MDIDFNVTPNLDLVEQLLDNLEFGFDNQERLVYSELKNRVHNNSKRIFHQTKSRRILAYLASKDANDFDNVLKKARKIN
ncbi:hypothetical protein PHYBLDRAFT_147940 [Phycomyces blakesleeanus NRRL 1555(-)]|uniref:Uncharacterized protein n=1 Tax=Phycomyces blakesleeanus (strain ATCC 8743b / DSM 1359 / FGSC 10004 / NBRC 33097 / NRRL 1555) TaxID=763407 RepID=A0A163DEG8_PHYB8|nr:hypothetical protein PHYBLDRAFT_147940 [Phycomyces blakesleeanus NRRL 1555(-)]OAD70710.1 hypothetical protein PHYBLDRAFT_147940 [Phycomyces blakesleeanus NRRL 1555(-)]|eukprot:XP_018288750.1 hypothetical protein PHYBLDRAFT_147940 [Phycomyces blakesleeanus NRRL 1555(-)]